MILLFVVFAWIGLLSIVVGLCLAAQMGDRAQLVSQGQRSALGEQPLQIPVPSSLRTSEPRRALLDRDGVAA
ncbi:MAG TPA: hypothetical protein VK721_03050 [Solirubrobacteraceae bacterium]|jgi:hypothetical protein|nr:hypothetical protein [Solirubrobacteraceae bacterium]